MEAILNIPNHRFYFHKIISMLIERNWISSPKGEEQKTKYNADDIPYYFEITLDKHDTCKKVKLYVHLNYNDLDASKIDPVFEENCKLFIVYSRNCGTSKYIKNFDSIDKPWIEIINSEIIQHDNQLHVWTGKHEIIHTKDDIFAEGGIYDYRTLPTIFHSDSQSRYIGAKHNDIIKITTIDQIKYRRCVYGYI